MMTFERYHQYLNEWEDKNKELGRRIAYREIQLIGRKNDGNVINAFLNCANSDSTVTEEEKKILNNDEILRSLKFEQTELSNEMQYVLKYASLPMLSSDVNHIMKNNEEDI